jgi:hypothetical protein
LTQQPGKGVSIELSGEEVLEVDFGKTSSQDLLLDLGPPIRKYWKEDDRMARMWGTMGGGNADDDGDCE